MRFSLCGLSLSGYCYGPDARPICCSCFPNCVVHRRYIVVLWRQILVLVAVLLIPATSWAGQLWSNRNGSLVRTSDGQANWMEYDYWNNMLADAAADGAGGVVSTASQDVLIANEVMVPMTMTETASAAEIAAAAAFLPEAAIYAIAGAALGSLIWDAATQSYAIQQPPGPSSNGTCADGSSPYVMLSGQRVYTADQLWSIDTAPGGNSYGSTLTVDASSGWNSSGQLVLNLDDNGSFWGNWVSANGSCDDGSSPGPGQPSLQDVPPSSLPPYVLPWLQTNPNQAPPLAGKEGSSVSPPQSSGPVLSGPPQVVLPPVTTTTTNPDGSKTTKTTTTTITLQYSGPNASGSPTSVTKTSYTPAPTASVPNPASSPGPTTSSSSSAPLPSSAPQFPFTPPVVAIPPVQPVPPGVINLPIPNIDNNAGTCPAPIVLDLGLPGLQTLTWDLTPWCTLASNLRPLVLTAAALACAFLLVR